MWKTPRLLAALLVVSLPSFAAVTYEDLTERGRFDPQERFKLGQKYAEERIAATVEAIQKAPLKTTATVVRGDKTEEVDFADAKAVGKLRDFDEIQLEEGVYNGFGPLKARSVRFLGKGKGKTFVTSLRDATAPLATNGSDFWNLTIAHAHFQSGNGDGLYGAGIEVVGDFQVDGSPETKALRFAIRTVLSDLTASRLPRSTVTRERPWDSGPSVHFGSSHFGVGDQYTYWMTHLPEINDGDEAAKNAYSKITLSLVFGYQGSRLVMEDMQREALTPGNLAAAALAFEGAPKFPLPARAVYRELVARFATYLYRNDLVAPPKELDDKNFGALVAKAEAAKKKGLQLTALAALGEADRATFFVRHDKVRALAAAASGKTDSRPSGCSLSEPEHAGLVFQVGGPLKEKYPALALTGDCRIQFEIKDTSAGTQEGDSKIIKSKAIYGLNEQAAAREAARAKQIWMAEAAAERSREKAAQAQMLSHGEKMTSIAKKFGEGQLRIEGSGANKVMTFGSGNWGGSMSAGTAAQINTNTADAERHQAQADAAQKLNVSKEDLKVVSHETTSERTRSLDSFYGVEVRITGLGKPKTISGPTKKLSVVQNCTTQTTGHFVTGSNCTFATGDQGDLRKNYNLTEILPKLDKILQESFASVATKAVAKTKSADAATRLDGGLIASVTGGAYDAKKFEADYAAELGVSRPALTAAAVVYSY